MDSDGEDIVISSSSRKKMKKSSKPAESPTSIDEKNDGDNNIKSKKAPEALKGANGGYSWEDEYRRSIKLIVYTIR